MEERRTMTRMRDAELLRDYHRHLAEILKTQGVKATHSAAVRRTLTGSTPRYYVGFDLAYNTMVRLRLYGDSGCKGTLKQQMWRELYEKVDNEMRGRKRLTLSAALARVLAMGRASRYFMTESHADRVIRAAEREAAKKPAKQQGPLSGRSTNY